MTIPRPTVTIPCPACQGTHAMLFRMSGSPIVRCPSVRGPALRWYAPGAALVVGVEDDKKGKA